MNQTTRDLLFNSELIGAFVGALIAVLGAMGVTILLEKRRDKREAVHLVERVAAELWANLSYLTTMSKNALDMQFLVSTKPYIKSGLTSKAFDALSSSPVARDQLNSELLGKIVDAYSAIPIVQNLEQSTEIISHQEGRKGNEIQNARNRFIESKAAIDVAAERVESAFFGLEKGGFGGDLVAIQNIVNE